MGIFNFWKKKDDFGISDNFDPTKDPMGNDPSTNLSKDRLGLGQDNLGLDQTKDPSFDNNTSTSFDTPKKDMSFTQERQDQTDNKDIELISSKLDTIKAEIDSMNQRLKSIERGMDNDEKKKPVW